MKTSKPQGAAYLIPSRSLHHLLWWARSVAGEKESIVTWEGSVSRSLPNLLCWSYLNSPTSAAATRSHGEPHIVSEQDHRILPYPQLHVHVCVWESVSPHRAARTSATDAIYRWFIAAQPLVASPPLKERCFSLNAWHFQLCPATRSWDTENVLSGSFSLPKMGHNKYWGRYIDKKVCCSRQLVSFTWRSHPCSHMRRAR